MSRTDVVVVQEAFAWREEVPGTTPRQYTHHVGRKGETVSVPTAAVDRGVRLGAIARPEQAAAAMAEREADADAVPAGDDGDATLLAMKAAELVGYIQQHPGEASRVFALERARRDGPRVSVVRAAGYDPDTMEPLAPSPTDTVVEF